LLGWIVVAAYAGIVQVDGVGRVPQGQLFQLDPGGVLNLDRKSPPLPSTKTASAKIPLTVRFPVPETTKLLYTPGCTLMVSPFPAASTATWMLV